MATDIHIQVLTADEAQFIATLRCPPLDRRMGDPYPAEPRVMRRRTKAVVSALVDVPYMPAAPCAGMEPGCDAACDGEGLGAMELRSWRSQQRRTERRP
jgi:hypothetical protein